MATGLPSAWFVEIEFTAGVWTNVAANINQPVVIKVGRSDASTDSQPGTCTVVVENVDGAFTPDNPLSTYFPNLVEGKRLRVRVTKGTTSTRFLGRITAIEPDYPSTPTQATTTITAVDQLGDLAGITLDPAHVAYLKTTGTAGIPTGIWPLTETNSNNGAFDITGNYPPLRVVYLTSTGSVDFTADSSFTGDTEACVSLSPGAALRHQVNPVGTMFAASTQQFGGLFKLDAGSSGEVFAASRGKREAASSVYSVSWNGVDTITTNQGSSISGVTPGWHYLHLDTSAVSSTLWVDGVSSAGTSTGEYPTSISIGGTLNLSARDVFFIGFTSASVHVPIIRRLAFGVGSTLTTQATDLSTLAGITVAWTTAETAAGAPLGSGGRTGLDVALDMARGRAGIVYADYGAGTVKLLAGADSRPAAVSMTIDAEADAVGGPTLSRGAKSGIGRVTAKSLSAEATAVDTTAGTLTADVDSTLSSPVDLYSVASDLISRGRDQKLRLRSLQVDLVTATNDLYASLWALTPGDRVRYSNLPSTYFGVTYIDGYAEGWTEEISVDAYTVTFDLSPADAPREAVFDTSRFGFGDGVCTASALTSSGTSVTLTWTGGQLLSTAAGDYPMDLDINGERVTISAAPAGSASPQTVTIVRGVAPTVARAHSAGDPVEVWDCWRFAL